MLTQQALQQISSAGLCVACGNKHFIVLECRHRQTNTSASTSFLFFPSCRLCLLQDVGCERENKTTAPQLTQSQVSRKFMLTTNLHLKLKLKASLVK